MSHNLSNIIAKHWLFQNLDQKTRIGLSQKFITKDFSVGQYVFHQEDTAERLYVVLSGEVSIETHTSDGKVTKLAYLGQGEIFGELALIDEGVRSASVCITRRSQLASLSRTMFNMLQKDNPEFVQQMLKVFVARLRSTNRQVESLVALSVLQRTAQLLLQLSQIDGDDIRITQKVLSERLFASREKVNSKLKLLESAGAIQLAHSKIHIVSREKLSGFLDVDNLD